MARLLAKASRLILAALLAFACVDVSAEVFSLWPFQPSGRGGSWPGGAAAEVLNPKKLWTEPVSINGVDVSLGISLLDLPFDACVAQLRSAYPKASYAGNESSLLMETKLENGRRLRIFVVEMPGAYPAMQFSMELPPSLPSKPDWPSSLPLPPSSSPLSVMQFPNRGSTYGLYSSDLSQGQALDEMRKSLLSAGWALSCPDSSSGVSGGEVFVRGSSSEIAIVGSSVDDDGHTRGSVYLRKLKKQ